MALYFASFPFYPRIVAPCEKGWDERRDALKPIEICYTSPASCQGAKTVKHNDNVNGH